MQEHMTQYCTELIHIHKFQRLPRHFTDKNIFRHWLRYFHLAARNAEIALCKKDWCSSREIVTGGKCNGVADISKAIKQLFQCSLAQAF